MKCANCGVEIVPAEDSYTHMPTTHIAECVGGASPTPTPWWDIKPADPALAQCDECAALVLATGLARHQEWHHELRYPDR